MSTRKGRAASRRRRQRIINTVLTIGGLLVIVAIIAIAFNKPPEQQVSQAQVGKVLDNFTLTDVNGTTVQLNDFAGQTVLINAWATWCPPCRAEMPDLNSYYQAHKDQGFTILAVNAGDSASDAAAFVNQNQLGFPVLLDPAINLLNSLGVRSFPTSIVIGSDGVVKSIHVGMYTLESLETEVTPLLQND